MYIIPGFEMRNVKKVSFETYFLAYQKYSLNYLCAVCVYVYQYAFYTLQLILFQTNRSVMLSN